MALDAFCWKQLLLAFYVRYYSSMVFHFRQFTIQCFAKRSCGRGQFSECVMGKKGYLLKWYLYFALGKDGSFTFGGCATLCNVGSIQWIVKSCFYLQGLQVLFGLYLAEIPREILLDERDNMGDLWTTKFENSLSRATTWCRTAF